jgi:hypothetical protein
MLRMLLLYGVLLLALTLELAATVQGAHSQLLLPNIFGHRCHFSYWSTPLLMVAGLMPAMRCTRITYLRPKS